MYFCEQLIELHSYLNAQELASTKIPNLKDLENAVVALGDFPSGSTYLHRRLDLLRSSREMHTKMTVRFACDNVLVFEDFMTKDKKAFAASKFPKSFTLCIHKNQVSVIVTIEFLEWLLVQLKAQPC